MSLKTTATTISHDIQEQNRKHQRKWPPSPQEVLDDVRHYHSDSLYNLIAWIVNPTSSYDENGIVKLSKPKATKVSKICDDIESLIPNSCPSLSQVLLSLNVYRKTGSSVIVNDLHKFGHGISYTETKFIEDKWAEWSENTSNIVPANIKQGVVVTHVVDNIDWKNKNFKGKETHNTNSILIQQLPYSSHPTTGLNIIPDYNFNRSQHRSFKGFKTQLPNIHFVRSECKQLPYQEEKEKKEYSNSTLTNFIWLLARLSSSSSGVQNIPSWSGFQRLLHHRHQVPKAISKADIFNLLLLHQLT